MIKLTIDDHLDRAALTLSRLNNMWSFTGKQLSFCTDNYLRPRLGEPEDRLDNLLRAYSCLTKAAAFYIEQGYIIPDFWNSTFAKVGQAIIFELPERLHKKKEKAFYKKLQKGFSLAWGESPLPPV